MTQYTAYGCAATPDLLFALIKDKGRWAKAVLSQGFGVPEEVQKELLSGEATWLTPNEKTLIITRPGSR